MDGRLDTNLSLVILNLSELDTQLKYNSQTIFLEYVLLTEDTH